MQAALEPVPLTGAQHRLAAGPYEAVVVEVGAGVRELRHRGQPILDGYGPQEAVEGARGQLLVPWPNRVDGGRYRFAGEERQLDLSEPAAGNALHGLARWASWTVLERGPDRIGLGHRLHAHPGYPHVLDLRVEHRLDADEGLLTVVAATNRGDRPAPYGVGMHPYLTAGAASVDACELTIPADSWMPTDDRGIPRGTEPVDGTPFDFRVPRPIGSLAIDYAFCDLRRDGAGRATLSLHDPASGRRTSLWVDEAIPWIEVFTGDTLPTRARAALGVEPMSCAPDAFNNGQGLVELAPGRGYLASWGIWAA
jgi:aldose 1-epimerase